MSVEDRLEPLLEHRRVEGDLVNNAVLDAFIGAFSDGMERLALVAFGEGELSGERFLRDPRHAPLWALAHAAMYMGATLPQRLPGESDADYTARARREVVYPRGIRRGTHEAVRIAVEPFLTGAKNVYITDDAGGPYDIAVRTRASETPDPDAVQLAIEGSYVSGGPRGAIRAEQKLDYVVSDELTINELDGTIDSYSVTIDQIGTP